MHVHDLNLKILHLLEINQTAQTWWFQGRDYRLTDVHGTVVDGLLG